MSVVNLTKREADAARSIGCDQCLWDAEVKGFGLRVPPSGVKVYIVQYRAGQGRQSPVRRFTIGRHGAPWTPEQARREAKRILGDVAAGGDPAKQRKAARQADKGAPTIRHVAEQWLAEHVEAKRKSRTAFDYRRLLNNVILPTLGAKRMSELTRAEVARLHYARRSTHTRLTTLSASFHLCAAGRRFTAFDQMERTPAIESRNIGSTAANGF